MFFVVQLFGFRNEEGERRFTTALLAVARKNAKSTLAAGILIYCLCCEDELGAQVITAATTGSQARVVFNIAKKMIEATRDLRQAFALEPFANAIARWQTGGSFKPINAKASTQDGLNPSHTVLDEIHAHKTHDLLNVLQSAAGARSNPLWLYTTTEGYETPGPWPELRTFAQQVLKDVLPADHFLALIFALDDEEGSKGSEDFRPADDDFDETKWGKANPLLDVNPYLMTEMRKSAIEAKQMPGRLAEFRIKKLNRQSSTAKGWIRYDKWKACVGKPIDLAALERDRVPCWGAFDLSSTTDFCAFRLVWFVNGIYVTWGRRWVPAAAVSQRTVRGTVPYAAWVGGGQLEQTDGETIDQAVVQEAIVEACLRFNVKSIGYDRWNASQVVKYLEGKRVPLEEFIQGPKSYHPAMQEFERAYIAGELAHGGDPVLGWCASNIVVRYDANLNMAPDKKRSGDKIDDMVALLMAIGVRARAKTTDYKLFVI